MSRNRHQTLLILGDFTPGSWLGDLLGFPETSALDPDIGNLIVRLQSISGWLLEQTPPRSLHRRSLLDPRGLDGRVQIERIEVIIPPPASQDAWRDPVALGLHLVIVDRLEAGLLGFLPELGLVSVAPDPTRLRAAMAHDAQLALLGRGHARSLQGLLRLPLMQRVEVRAVELGGGLPGAGTGFAADEDAAPPTLAQVADDLCAIDLPPAHRLEEHARRLAALIGGLPPRSVLLVGPRGSGKTSTLHEVVRRRHELGLQGVSFYSTTGSRLLAGMTGFGMWQERCRRLCREAARHRAIIGLGSLLELSELGRHESNTQSLAGFLRPAIARGELLAVAECTREELSILEGREPQLAQAFDVMEVDAPDVERLDAILRDEADHLNQRTGAVLDQGALAEVRRLHRRYSPCSGVPSRPLSFLRRVAEEAAGGLVLRAEHVDAAFARESGLPLAILSEREPLDLVAARRWFEGRVLGQSEAVDRVVDVLASIKARLTRPDRPIANLLFAGPTGVGKTEMARSLAAYLFGDDGRMLRLDMSEFSDPYSVARLHAGPGGGILTSRLREQPFSVVLFDEVEKADRSFFDLLLSMLGEGRVTDAAGRLVDLSSAVIVLTSNLGAGSFSAGSGGFSVAADAGARAREHFLGVLQDSFRPELLGRLDSVVLFEPLGHEIVLRLVDREVELISEREGARRYGLELEVSLEARQLLATLGDDPRQGARPLKRVVEKRLLAPLSAALARIGPDSRIQVEVEVDGGELSVRATSHPRPPHGSAGDDSLLERLIRLGRSLRRLRARLTRDEISGSGRDHLDRVRDLAGRAAALEDELLVSLAASEDDRDPGGQEEALRARIDEVETGHRELGLDLLSARLESPDVVTLALYAEDKSWLAELARVYSRLAERLDLIAAGSLVSLAPQGGRGQRASIIEPVSRLEVALAGDLRQVIGVVLEIAGDHARVRLGGEAGLHELRSRGRSSVCLVDVGTGSLSTYTPPVGVERARHGEGGARRRLYDPDRGVVEGAADTRVRRWLGRGLEEVLESALDDSLAAVLAELESE